MYNQSAPLTAFVGWMLLTAILHLVYSIAFITRYGQTPGKWLMGVRVLDETETRHLTFIEAFRREMIYFIIEITGILVFLYVSTTREDDGTLYNGYRSFVRNVGLIWVWLVLASMLSNPKRRSIHDFLGRAVVVRG